jgi:hypothetical protein
MERSLEKVRRRVKVIGRFPGETSCLSLRWAVLDLVISAARGLGLTDLAAAAAGAALRVRDLEEGDVHAAARLTAS